jgi:hypothetical protein
VPFSVGFVSSVVKYFCHEGAKARRFFIFFSLDLHPRENGDPDIWIALEFFQNSGNDGYEFLVIKKPVIAHWLFREYFYWLISRR